MNRLAVSFLVLALSATAACGVNASQVATNVATATVLTAASVAVDAALCPDCCEADLEGDYDPDALGQHILRDDQRYDPFDESRISEAKRGSTYAPEEDAFGPSFYE